MRAIWPTARKSEPEPGASAGARLRNRSGRQSDEPVVAPFFVGAAPLMPNVLPPPGACPCRCPGSCPGSCRARARHIPAGRAVRLPCGAWERPSSAGRGCGVVRPPVGMCGRRSISPRFLPLLPPFFSRILSLPGSFRHRPPFGAWERPSSAEEGMRGGPSARRNVRAAEYFSPVPFAAAALLFPNPFSPRFLPPSSSLRRLGAALLHGEGMRGGPSARRNVRAAECFSPVPSAATALLFPVPVRAARFFGKKMRWGEINAIFAPKSSEA